jgi:hypothetical protein
MTMLVSDSIVKDRDTIGDSMEDGWRTFPLSLSWSWLCCIIWKI